MSIEEFLASEAKSADTLRSAEGSYVRSRRVPKDPSQVYSLRLPVERIAELREIADRSAVAPSALMRRWVLERLDEEAERASHVSETREARASEDVVVMSREEFDRHTVKLVELVSETMAKKFAASLPGSRREA